MACLFILWAFERSLFRTRHHFRLPIGVLNPMSLISHANLTAQPRKYRIEQLSTLTSSGILIQHTSEGKHANIFFSSKTPNFPFSLRFYCHFQPNKIYGDDASRRTWLAPCLRRSHLTEIIYVEFMQRK